MLICIKIFVHVYDVCVGRWERMSKFNVCKCFQYCLSSTLCFILMFCAKIYYWNEHKLKFFFLCSYLIWMLQNLVETFTTNILNLEKSQICFFECCIYAKYFFQIHKIIRFTYNIPMRDISRMFSRNCIFTLMNHFQTIFFSILIILNIFVFLFLFLLHMYHSSLYYV